MFASPESTEAVVAGNGGGLLVDAAVRPLLSPVYSIHEVV
jgi:hypothetical protein